MTGRRQGRVIVVPPTRRMVRRALKDSGSEAVAWCYFGETVSSAAACREWLDGLAERIEAGEFLQEMARDKRQSYIEFMGELSRRYSSDSWWLASLSEKNPYISKVFLRACSVLVADRLVRERDGKGILLLVVEDRALRQCLSGHLRPGLGNDLLCPEGFGEGFRVRVRQIAEFWARWVHFLGRQFSRLLIARMFVSGEEIQRRRGVGLTLIHSWVDSRAFDGTGAYRSIHFGDLDRYLASQGRTVAIVPGILPSLSFRSGVRALVRSGVPFLLPQRFLRLSDVLREAWRSLRRPPEIACPPFEHVDISALIEEDRQQDWMLGRPRVNAMLGSVVRRWYEAGIRIESFVYTFENHLWEKAYCLAFRRHYAGVRLVGYQNVNLPSLSLNFFVAEPERALMPLPDLLIANGRYSFELLAHDGHDPERLRCGGALGYLHLAGLAAREPARSLGSARDRSAPRFTVLVTTSNGVPLACELLWKAIQAFTAELGIRVLIKCHPGLLFAALSSALGLDRLPANFEVCDRPVPELLRRCAALLYMDSTSSLEALAIGVPVVHVVSDFGLDIDHLERMSEVRLSARTPEELRRAVLSLTQEAEEEGAAADRRRRGREVVTTFFGPSDEQAYRWFLDSREPGCEAPAIRGQA